MSIIMYVGNDAMGIAFLSSDILTSDHDSPFFLPPFPLYQASI